MKTFASKEESLVTISMSLKSKRDQYSYEIRKKKNDQLLATKRVVCSKEKGSDSKDKCELQEHFQCLADDFKAAIRKDDLNEIIKTLRAIRIEISQDEYPPVEYLAETGCLPFISKTLTKELAEHVQVQFEAAWILTNVVSGSKTLTKLVALELQGIDKFIEVLKYSPDIEVQMQVIWGLGNMCADEYSYRKRATELDLIDLLIRKIEDNLENVSFLRNSTFLMGNLCRGKQKIPYDNVLDKFLPIIKTLLLSSSDTDVQSNLLWTLVSLAEGEDYQIDEITELGIAKTIVEMCKVETYEISFPAFRLCCTILTGEDSACQTLLDNGMLPVLVEAIDSDQKNVRKEAYWAISNLFACGKDIRNMIFEDEVLFQKFIENLLEEPKDNQKEILFGVFNAISEGNLDHIYLMTECGIISTLLEVLKTVDDSETLMLALDSLQMILKAGRKISQGDDSMNLYLIELEDYGGVKIIEKLQTHKNEKLYARVASLIDEFFVPYT